MGDFLAGLQLVEVGLHAFCMGIQHARVTADSGWFIPQVVT
jgi:hypothetical protein